MMRSWVLVASAVAVCVWIPSPQLGADEKDVGENGRIVQSPSLLVFAAKPVFQSGQYIARIDAGRLNAGHEYSVRVEIESPSSEPISFKAIKPSCVCLDAKLSRMSLSPSEAITLNFRVSVPKKMQRENSAWGIFLEPDTKTGLGGIQINMSFEVAGLLSFYEKRLVLEAGSRERDAEFNVPMFLTMPVESDNIMVHLPESLKSVKTKVVTTDGKSFLNLIVPKELLETLYVSGQISCMDSTTGMEDTIYCVIKGESPAAIYPSILRGRIADDGSATISAMLRVGPSKRSNLAESKNSSLIDASFDNKPLPLELQAISETYIRASIIIPSPLIDSMKKSKRLEISWTIRTKEETLELRSPIIFTE